jgi:MoxR-like ATPase
VLLIDEIDKAEPSLPNSLLEVLGNGGFEVPFLGETIGKQKAIPPLVIITTNDERELPPAFVRRCLVLHLKVDDTAFEKWFLDRANVHCLANQCSETIKKLALQQLKADREAAEKLGQIKPGLAEYLDLLKALDEMTNPHLQGDERDGHQTTLLGHIQDFVLKKAL